MSTKRCNGPCGRKFSRTEEFWRPRKDAKDGLRSVCRQCESTLGGLRRDGIKAAHTKQPVSAQTLRKTAPKSKVYVITYAQNATPVNQAFLNSLLTYCKHNNAELLVLPGRYTNPTSIWSKNMQTNEWWDSKLAPYLFVGRKTLGGHLTIFGDISIQPTATRPLTGFEVFAQDHSAIFGHPKVQLKTIATAKRYYPRILTTTGAVTRPNYTPSKAGKKAEARHVYGATVIEQGEQLFHVRQVTAARDGSFIDLDMHYSAESVQPAGRALALICGDIHVEQSDPKVLAATFEGPQSIVQRLHPERIILHDVLDFHRRNHHQINSFTDRYARVKGARKDLVEEEVLDAVRFIDDVTPEDTETTIVASNHDEAYDRWLCEADIRRDPVNAYFFHRSWVLKLQEFDSTHQWTSAFELLYRENGSERAKFLSREETLKVADIYVNFHGDEGLNGSRSAGAETYSKLGVKTIIGHCHTPGILDDCFSCGVTGKLDQGYNGTPSSWMNSHVAVYADGNRTILNVIHGAWCGESMLSPALRTKLSDAARIAREPRPPEELVMAFQDRMHREPAKTRAGKSTKFSGVR